MAEQEITSITAEQWTGIQADLEKLLKTKRKPSETLAVYAQRLAKMANDPKKISDEMFQTLDDLSGNWVNSFLVANEKGTGASLLPPEDPSSAVDTAADEGVTSGDEAKETAESAATAPSKASGRTKPKSKPAKAPVPEKAPTKKAKDAAAPPAKKAPAKSKADADKSRGRPALFNSADVIKIVNKEPFRAGTASADGFSKIKDGATVKKAMDAGAPRRLIRWAKICGYIEVKSAA